MRKGFTLIELLVVVLIIGILAGVALPQYEKAVMKARFIGARQLAESGAKASEVYREANGRYPYLWDSLDLDFGKACGGASGSVLQCKDHFWLDLLAGDSDDNQLNNGTVEVYYCPNSADWNGCMAAYEYRYTIPMQVSRMTRVCLGRTDKGKQFCKTITE